MFNNSTRDYLESNIASQQYENRQKELAEGRRNAEILKKKRKDSDRRYLDRYNRRLIQHMGKVQADDYAEQLNDPNNPFGINKFTPYDFDFYSDEQQELARKASDENESNQNTNPEPQTGNNETTESGQPATQTSSEAEQQIQNDQTQKQNARATWNNINHKQMQDAGFSQNDIVNLQRQLGVKADGIFGMQSACPHYPLLASA